MFKADLNTLYYNLLFPFILENEELGERLGIKNEIHMTVEFILEQIGVIGNRIRKIQLNQIKQIVVEYNKISRETIREWAKILLNYALTNDINLISRIRDRIKYLKSKTKERWWFRWIIKIVYIAIQLVKSKNGSSLIQ